MRPSRWYVVVVLVALLTTGVGFTEGQATLSEQSTLRAEIYRLKSALVQAQISLNQCRAQMAQTELEQNGRALEAEFRTELKAPVERRFNWNTLTFDPPPESPK